MASASPRNPYNVGGWVTGENFYGHIELRHNLLNDPNRYLWVIGTRRSGKTSLLRQLELDAKDSFLPIYWDLQGCENEGDLGDELFYALEEKKKDLKAWGLDVGGLEGEDVRGQLRQVCAAATEHNRQILLLIDEPEVLISIGRQNVFSLRRLRAAFQRPENLRVIIASTKVLAQIDQVDPERLTSAFLLGFAPRQLAGFTNIEAESLIRRTQSLRRVKVDKPALVAIMRHTNNHPYLLQWLCYRLYRKDGSLREPTDEDIVLDSMLNTLFDQNFRHLSPTERRILLHLAPSGQSTSSEISTTLELSSKEAYIYLYALNRMGYTRQTGSKVRIGNSFLRLWLETHADTLGITDTEVSDDTIRAVAMTGQEQEKTYWQQQLQVYRVNLARLEVEAANYGQHPPLHIDNEIDFHKRKIRELEDRLDALNGLDPEDRVTSELTPPA